MSGESEQGLHPSRVLEFRVDEHGNSYALYRVGDREPMRVTAWNCRLWFEDGGSTHMRTTAPRPRR